MMPLPDSEPYRLPEPACLIRRVRIQNYKSIRLADVSLGPFTILVGRNGSGKSNFLDALHFVADSLRISLEQATESRGGVEGVESVVRGSRNKPVPLVIEIEISLPSGNGVELRFVLFAKNQRFIVRREELVIRSKQRDIIAHYAVHRGEIESASIQSLPPAEEDRLYLIKASGFDPFREVYDALTVMGFYNLNPEAMRAIQSKGPGDLLHGDGANVASVVRRLEEQDPREISRLEAYLSAIVPDLVGVRVLSLGPRETLTFRQKMAGEEPAVFFAANMSDGTLRVTGILAAVAQLSGQQKPITLIGIEEPETSLHPAATRALMDALRDAAVRSQVIVTTHSPDLLDQVEMDHESVLAVLSHEGETRIAPLDDASLEVIRDSLYTPGELLRLDQLEPNLKDLARQEQTLASWSEEDDAPVADRSDRRRPR